MLRNIFECSKDLINKVAKLPVLCYCADMARVLMKNLEFISYADNQVQHSDNRSAAYTFVKNWELVSSPINFSLGEWFWSLVRGFQGDWSYEVLGQRASSSVFRYSCFAYRALSDRRVTVLRTGGEIDAFTC